MATVTDRPSRATCLGYGNPGSAAIFNATGFTQVVVDVFGYFTDELFIDH